MAPEAILIPLNHAPHGLHGSLKHVFNDAFPSQAAGNERKVFWRKNIREGLHC